MSDFLLTDKARILAQQLHAGQVRRVSGAPFFEAHLYPVAMKVAANQGDDLAIAAAYLHDAPEDVGTYTREMIRTLSPQILRIVDLLTEQGKKENWEERKESYLTHIRQYDARSLLISLCDKCVTGHDFIAEWEQGAFGKRPERICWFYTQLWHAYYDRAVSLEVSYDILLEELALIRDKLTRLFTARPSL